MTNSIQLLKKSSSSYTLQRNYISNRQQHSVGEKSDAVNCPEGFQRMPHFLSIAMQIHDKQTAALRWRWETAQQNQRMRILVTDVHSCARIKLIK